MTLYNSLYIVALTVCRFIILKSPFCHPFLQACSVIRYIPLSKFEMPCKCKLLEARFPHYTSEKFQFYFPYFKYKRHFCSHFPQNLFVIHMIRPCYYRHPSVEKHLRLLISIPHLSGYCLAFAAIWENHKISALFTRYLIFCLAFKIILVLFQCTLGCLGHIFRLMLKHFPED